MEKSDGENSSGVGGCFDPDPVLIVPDVWEKLIAAYRVGSVLDVGCGYGYAVKWFVNHSIITLGIDGFSQAVKNTVAPGHVHEWDYTDGPLPFIGGRFDLCWCCEFVEHVEEKYIPNFIPCFKACRHIALTHATPGQGGFHHVNEQPSEYWIEKLKGYGFTHDEEASRNFRRPARYGVNNLLIFHYGCDPAGWVALASEIGA